MIYVPTDAHSESESELKNKPQCEPSLSYQSTAAARSFCNCCSFADKSTTARQSETLGKKESRHSSHTCAVWGGMGRGGNSHSVIRARATFPLGKCTAAAPAASLVQIGVDSVDQNLHFERYLLRIRIPKLDGGLRTAIRSVANVDPR